MELQMIGEAQGGPMSNGFDSSSSFVTAKTWYHSSTAAEMEDQLIGGFSLNPVNSHADHSHVVTVAMEEGRNWSSLMHQRLRQMPTCLTELAGNQSCCIFRVPMTFVELKPKAYEPHIVSIGPYHHGNECVKMIEEHKPRLFSALLTRTRNNGVDLDDYFSALASKEQEIRECYAEPLKFRSLELIEMMVLDGCFIIEVFRVSMGIVRPDPADPIFKMLWPFTSFMHDFLHLENQVPFFVLQMLYDKSKLPTEPSLVYVALESFACVMERPQPVEVRDIKHLLHLIHSSYTKLPAEALGRGFGNGNLDLVPSVTELRRMGIKFKPRKCNELLDIRFNDGVLEMPPLTMDGQIGSLFLNCVAFEQCYSYCPRIITDYLMFIGCLMTTEDDVRFLMDHQMLSYYGTKAELTSFLNNLGKDVGFDVTRSYLAGEMEKLNKYCGNQWRVCVWWTELKLKYFDTTWSGISALAASLLLMLTIIQSVIALYSYMHPPKQ